MASGLTEARMTIHITLKLFGGYLRFLPCDGEGHACDVEVPEGATVDDVLRRFEVPTEDRVVLVNGRVTPLDRVLEEEDVLAAFPALAGG